MRVLAAAVYAVLAISPLVRAGSPSAELTCVESLTLPTTGILAARASGSGTVKAIARIGAEGQLASLHLDGGDATLKWDVTAALEVSCFKPRCTGRKAAFEFAFTLLEDNPTDYIAAPLVRFVPPNPLRTDFPAREREY